MHKMNIFAIDLLSVKYKNETVGSKRVAAKVATAPTPQSHEVQSEICVTFPHFVDR